MKRSWLVLMLLSLVSFASLGFAVTGARQGCLAVINELNRPLQRYVQGSSQDTLAPWIVPARTNRVLDRTAKVGAVVNEQTIIWVAGATKSYPKIALRADRSAWYIPGAKQKDCAAAGLWAKRFR